MARKRSSSSYLGITVKFGADTKALGTALDGINAKCRNLDKELRLLNNSLKLDPENQNLTNQKFEVLNKAIQETQKKLMELKKAEAQVDAGFADGTIGEEAFRSFKREIENTRIKLKQLNTESDKLKNISASPTFKIGANTQSLDTALKDINLKCQMLDKELVSLNGSLKLDPKSVILTNQKFEVLGKAVQETQKKLYTLSVVQSQMQEKLANGEVSLEFYARWQRELESTKAKLKQLTAERDKMNSLAAGLDGAADSTHELGEELEKTRKEKLDKLTSSAGELKSEMQETAQAIGQSIAKIVTAIGAATTAALAASVKVGSEFEAAMSTLAATMAIDKTAEDYQKLSDFAKKMGAETKFTAAQAAEALNKIALAGYNAEKQMKTLPVVLNLAAAGNMDLAVASDMVTDAMAALGIAADDVTVFSDKIAKAAQKSNTDISQLGEAILTIGGTAKQLAGGTSELNTALGILADVGIKGAEGGTILRNIINDLVAPTADATAELEKMDVALYNTDGSLRSLGDIFLDIKAYLAQFGNSDKAVNDTLNKIFDVRNLKGVTALLTYSGDRFNELMGYMADCDGAAQQMAETMSDNLKGSLTILQSALEACGTTIYEKVEQPFRNATETAIREVTRLNSSMINGELKPSIDKITRAFGNLLDTVVDFAVDDGIPALINGLEWVAENGPTIKAVLVSIGTSMLTFKAVTFISKATLALKAYKEAAQATATQQALLNAVIGVNPWVLIATAIVAATSFLATYTVAAMKANDVTKKYREELENIKNDYKNSSQQSEAEVILLEKKIDRYNQLRKELGENKAASAEFKALAEELQEQLGGSVTVIGKATGAYFELGNAAKKATEEMRKAAELNAINEKYEALIAEQLKVKDAFHDASLAYSEMVKEYKAEKGWTDEEFKASGIEYDFKMELGLPAYSAQLDALRGEISRTEQQIQSFYTETDEVAKRTDTSISGTATQTSETIKTFAAAMQEATANLQDTKDALSSCSSALSELNSAFQEQANNGSLSADTIMKLIDSGYGLALQWDEATGTCTLLSDKVKELTKAKYAKIKADLMEKSIDLKEKYEKEKEAVDRLGASIQSIAESDLYWTRKRALDDSERQIADIENYAKVINNLFDSIDKVDVVTVKAEAEVEVSDNSNDIAAAELSVEDEKIAKLKEEKELLEAIQKARQQELDIKKAIVDLENAQNQKTKNVYYAEKGFQWEADKSAVEEKANSLQTLLENRQISNIDNQINGIDLSQYTKDVQSIVDSISSITSQLDETGQISSSNSLAINIENLNTDNPTNFVEELNRLMSEAKMQIMLKD